MSAALPPILMTTMCALLGGVPLMLGTGIGSEIRQPLGCLDHWLSRGRTGGAQAAIAGRRADVL